MAVYRERRRPRALLWALLAAALLLILALVALALGVGRPAAQTPRDRAQAGLRDMSEALDLFTIEYPKSRDGQPSGAAPALTRARAALDRVKPDLQTLDPASAAALDAGLRALETEAAAQSLPNTVVGDAASLRRQVQDWLARP
jgi:hypothetical protein